MSKAKTIEGWKSEIKSQGYAPFEDHENSNAEVTMLEALCQHGYGLWIWTLKKKDGSELYEIEEADKYQDTCDPCVISKMRVVCPGCDEPWVRPSDEELAQAWRDDRDLLFDTKCPKCGSRWIHWTGEGPEPEGEKAEEAEGWELAYAPAPVAVKVGRNDPCPCGSGKKHKKCCLGATKA